MWNHTCSDKCKNSFSKRFCLNVLQDPLSAGICLIRDLWHALLLLHFMRKVKWFRIESNLTLFHLNFESILSWHSFKINFDPAVISLWDISWIKFPLCHAGTKFSASVESMSMYGIAMPFTTFFHQYEVPQFQVMSQVHLKED